MRNFTKLFLLTIVSATLLLSACTEKEKSKLLAEKMTTTNLVDLSEKVKADPLLDYRDIEMIVAGMKRINVKDLDGMTLGELVEAQEEFARKVNVRALIVTANKNEMIAAHTFHFKNLQALQNTKTDQYYFAISFELENLLDKDIKQMAGNLTFMDVKGNQIKTFQSQITKEVPAGEKVPMTITSAYDPDSKIDPILQTLFNQRKVSINWTPLIIDFTDGTKLTAAPPKEDKKDKEETAKK
jgi:hypothetical protein